MTTVGPRLVFILRFLRSMKDVCMTKSIYFDQVYKTQHCDDG